MRNIGKGTFGKKGQAFWINPKEGFALHFDKPDMIAGHKLIFGCVGGCWKHRAIGKIGHG
jgi:hypothetical protein